MSDYSVAQAAAELEVDERTIRHRIKRGYLKAERVGARVWLIPRKEVERAKQQGRLAPGPPKGTPRPPRREDG